MNEILRRYTDLPFLFDYLHTKELALLNPKSWDDKNDSYFVGQYAKANGFNSTYALCMTEAPETYHHWKIFTSGSSGVCIEFKKEALLSYSKRNPEIRAESIEYKTIKSLRAARPTSNQLPFLKRQAYSDEREFRFFIANDHKEVETVRLFAPASTISRIVLSPWVPASVSLHLKATIKEIAGFKTTKVYRSTLIANENWKKLAE
jgi:hypothetical protein